MNYIPLSDVINEVKVSFSSFYESTQEVSDALYVPECRLFLRRLGKKILDINSAELEVENYKVELPEDFESLILAIGILPREIKSLPEDRAFNTFTIEEFYTQYKINECSASDPQCDMELNIVQTLPDGRRISWQEHLPLTVSKFSKSYCASNCINNTIKSEHEILIKDGYITTNFNGRIYLEYYKSPDELMIPDDEIILKAFKEIIKLAILEHAYMNSTQDVVQRLQYQKRETDIAKINAVNLVKRSEYKEMQNLNNYFKSKFNFFNSLVYGNVKPKYKY